MSWTSLYARSSSSSSFLRWLMSLSLYWISGWLAFSWNSSWDIFKAQTSFRFSSNSRRLCSYSSFFRTELLSISCFSKISWARRSLLADSTSLDPLESFLFFLFPIAVELLLPLLLLVSFNLMFSRISSTIRFSCRTKISYCSDERKNSP